MFRKKVALDVFEVNLVRVIVYLASWLLKVISALLIARAIKHNEVNKVVGHFISIS